MKNCTLKKVLYFVDDQSTMRSLLKHRAQTLGANSCGKKYQIDPADALLKVKTKGNTLCTTLELIFSILTLRFSIKQC